MTITRFNSTQITWQCEVDERDQSVDSVLMYIFRMSSVLLRRGSKPGQNHREVNQGPHAFGGVQVDLTGPLAAKRGMTGGRGAVAGDEAQPRQMYLCDALDGDALSQLQFQR